MELSVPTVIALRLAQPPSALLAILVTLFGIVMLVKPQALNAALPMLVTLLPIMTFVRP